ncbi:hypothetical protein CONLIGDRAFT_252859 [Coniochaeta ligniaria NRRL 30616]|uniref:Uncharacterized protein n=1 Tax=Coniochaeta ligniaria NRRL 30616 TaxID=1408157 RepID=A0A1J7JQ93_9PEZI|nr:hypothetical protein CONLIGDRAFT_252859 [Coniochaeta ligniaria NRRL 30616]
MQALDETTACAVVIDQLPSVHTTRKFLVCDHNTYSRCYQCPSSTAPPCPERRRRPGRLFFDGVVPAPLRLTVEGLRQGNQAPTGGKMIDTHVPELGLE